MKHILFILCFGLGAGISAQQPKEPVDTKAKAILDELSAKTKACGAIKAEFLIENFGTDKKLKESNTGKLTSKGQKYIVEFKGQKIVCDSKTQWTIIDESKEVQVNDAPDGKSADQINPTNIFTIYEKNFKYKFEKEETVNGTLMQVINLYPLSPGKKAYHTIKLYIDKTKKQVAMLKIMNKDATSSTITVKSFSCYTEPNDAQFTVTKKEYPSPPWEWIDLKEN
ncbi:MAG: outer membrane lipoprotein carrier protein LolA [Bacteroidia bacterium]|nr:outer membrane lipoprotein carrier protein LolA [Bacteroidia bacterium]